MNGPSILDRMIRHPRQLFLIDSIGAMLTAALLAGVVAKLEGIFGMQPAPLYILAAIAGLFLVYSMSCYLFNPANWRPYMKAIALANLAYCCFTLVLVFFLVPGVTALGMAYFVGEGLIVGALVYLELRTALHVVNL